MLYHFAHAGHNHDDETTTVPNATTAAAAHTEQPAAPMSVDQTPIFVGGAAVAIIGVAVIAVALAKTGRGVSKKK